MIPEEDNKSLLNGEQLNNLPTDSNPARDFWEFMLDLLKTAVVVFAIAIVLRYFAVQPYIVDGESMMPNYENREYLLAEKVSYLIGSPQRGDVVIFRYPKNPSLNYIKRVIGLPGEKVRIENNKITVFNSTNPTGLAISEDYIPTSTNTYAPDGGVFEQTLKQDEYFVLGDNREHSSDSREWGVLPKENIAGRAWLTLLPFNEAGFHSRITYPTKLSVINDLKFAVSSFR